MGRAEEGRQWQIYGKHLKKKKKKKTEIRAERDE